MCDKSLFGIKAELSTQLRSRPQFENLRCVLLFANFIFLFPSSFPKISIFTWTEQNVLESRINRFNSALFSFPLWFLFVLLGARSPGEPRSCLSNMCFHLCTQEFIFFPFYILFIYTAVFYKNSTFSAVFLPPPPPIPCVLSSLQQGLQVRQKWILERYNNISL